MLRRHHRGLAAAASLAALLAGCVARPTRETLPPVAPHLVLRDDATMRRMMLRTHAAARAAVGVAPLEWNEGLAAEARVWATRLARSDRLVHAGQQEEGENLWMGTRDQFQYDEMTGFWIRERRYFTDPATPLVSRSGRWEDVGHYTQIVWRGTTDIGCALATNRSDDVLVCRYWPAGNVEGERAY